MIIRTIATALVQCMIRTQAGWITLAGVAPAWPSAAARLDVALDMAGSVHGDWIVPTTIRRRLAFVTTGETHNSRWASNDITKSRSQKSEPGRTRLALDRICQGVKRPGAVLRC